MMGVPDFELLLAGLFIVLLQLVFLTVAMLLGCWSLFLLLRRSAAPRRGFRLALIAVILSAVVETWIYLFFTPWRFLNVRPLLFLPLPSLQVGLCGVVFWGLAGSQRISGTGRMAIAVLAIGLAMGAVMAIRRQDQRREMLYWAEANAKEARSFEEASRDSHGMADYFLCHARNRKALSEAYRWAADHPGEPVPRVSSPDCGF